MIILLGVVTIMMTTFQLSYDDDKTLKVVILELPCDSDNTVGAKTVMIMIILFSCGSDNAVGGNISNGDDILIILR